MISYLKKVFYILRGSEKTLIFLFVTFTFSSVLEAIGVGMILPYLSLAADPSLIENNGLLSFVYQALGFQNPSSLVSLLGLVIIILVCIKSFSYFDINARIISFSYGQKKRLVSKLMSTYLRIPYTFHLGRNTASLIKNISYETDLFAYSCLIPLLQTFANMVVISALLLLLLKVNYILLLTIVALMLPLLLFFIRFSSAYKEWGKIVSESRQEIIRTLNHGLGGIKETRVIGCESYFEDEIDQHSLKLSEAAAKTQTYLLLPRIVVEAVLVISVMLIVLLSQALFQSSYEELIPSLSVFAVASIRLIPTASQFLQAVSKIRTGSYALSMLYNDLKELEVYQSDLNHSLGGTISSNLNSSARLTNQSRLTFKNQITLEGISYGYPQSDVLAVRNLSLSIEKGQSIAFIGKSGAGKTTLADIILGLLKPVEGDIKVDGTSIYGDIRLWQNLIGYIPQSIFLLDDTVERNVAFGVPAHLIDHNRLMSAIELAQLNELITQLPLGIQTSVGERGVRLSGGQRQRIGIARALYHEREILVLDEATSALDNETEQLISKAIDSLTGNKTLIVIAHRLSTIKNCNKVFLLNKGEIEISGTYEKVIESRLVS